MSSILYIAPFCHIPPLHGASQRGINLLLQLARCHDVTLLTYRKHDAEALMLWAKEHQIALRWLPAAPEHNHLSFLQRAFSDLPPGFASHSPDAIAAAIDTAWAEIGPFDLIYFATQLMGQAVLTKRWPARTALDLYDVYTPIAHAKIVSTSLAQPYHWLYRLEAQRVHYYEWRLLKYFDIVITASVEDAKHVGHLRSKARTIVVPNGVALPQVEPNYTQTQKVLLVGSYSYAPNAEGFLWFYKKVWPSILQQVPLATLVAVGESSENLQGSTNNDPSVHWAGRVPDLGDFYREAACVIVPVLSGGGTRLKLLEAMAWGVPVVSTALGAQGVEHEGTVGIANTAEQFASEIVRRLINTSAYVEQAQQARNLIACRYTWEQIGNMLLSGIKSCSA